jgi:hypothetical protein
MKSMSQVGRISDCPETLEEARAIIEEQDRRLIDLRDHLRKAVDENAKLKTALREADAAISAGQDCRSEAAFTRWMRDSQRYRPHADLIGVPATPPNDAGYEQWEASLQPGERGRV